ASSWESHIAEEEGDGDGEGFTQLNAEPTMGSAPPWAGAAAPAPAVRRRENLRSASFRDYAMAESARDRRFTCAVGGRGCGPCTRSEKTRKSAQRIFSRLHYRRAAHTRFLNTALPSPRPGVTPAPTVNRKIRRMRLFLQRPRARDAPRVSRAYPAPSLPRPPRA